MRNIVYMSHNEQLLETEKQLMSLVCLGASSKLRKATNSFAMSVCSSVHPSLRME